MRDAIEAVKERRMIEMKEALEGVPDAGASEGLGDLEVRDFAMTDAGNGDLITTLYGQRLRYDHQRERWFVWRRHSWRPDADGRAYRLAKAAARWRHTQANALPDDEATAPARTAQMRWARQSESRYRIGAALEAAARLHPIALVGDEWNADPWLLAVANGVVDLRSRELRPGQPEDLICFHSPVAYDAEARCPRWERFLEEIFEGDADSAAFMQRAMGYSLTGVTSEHAWFFLRGPGGNGKAVLLGALEHILGSYAFRLPFSSLEASRADRVPNDLAALAGRRLVVATEGRANATLHAAKLTLLTGEGTVSARFLHREFFEFRPACKLWLAGGDGLGVKDTSGACSRRCLVVPFGRSVAGAEADRELAATLRGEAAGVLNWAIAGCRAWQERGLAPPEQVARATEDYRGETNGVEAFIDDMCHANPKGRVFATELYHRYRRWCELNGIECLTQTGFGREMGRRFARERTDSGRKRYVGLSLVE